LSTGSSVSSNLTTQSAPLGSTAPVMMRMLAPGLIVRFNTQPARAVAKMRRITGLCGEVHLIS